MQTIQILVADDHALVRTALASMLQSEPDFAVIGEAEDGQMAIDLVDELQPDIVLMDITMPKRTGVEATHEIVSKHPQVRVIGLSMHERESLGQSILEAGAVAYVPKGGRLCELIATIRSVAGLNHSSSPHS